MQLTWRRAVPTNYAVEVVGVLDYRSLSPQLDHLPYLFLPPKDFNFQLCIGSTFRKNTIRENSSKHGCPLSLMKIQFQRAFSYLQTAFFCQAIALQIGVMANHFIIARLVECEQQALVLKKT